MKNTAVYQRDVRATVKATVMYQEDEDIALIIGRSLKSTRHNCGQYGHRKEYCPDLTAQEKLNIKIRRLQYQAATGPGNNFQRKF